MFAIIIKSYIIPEIVSKIDKKQTNITLRAKIAEFENKFSRGVQYSTNLIKHVSICIQ